jgi:hypothetical protein
MAGKGGQFSAGGGSSSRGKASRGGSHSFGGKAKGSSKPGMGLSGVKVKSSGVGARLRHGAGGKGGKLSTGGRKLRSR